MAAVDTFLVSAMSGSASSSSAAGSASSSGHRGTTYANFAPPSDALYTASSPLLATTPALVAKTLAAAYPLIRTVDTCLAVLTWTHKDPYLGVIVVAVYALAVLYWRVLTIFLAPVATAGLVAGFVHIQATAAARPDPTLDEIVHTLADASARFRLLLHPIATLDLSGDDVKRLAIAAVFLSPIYVCCATLLLSPTSVALLSGLVILTYHSLYARVIRTLLWRSRTVRLLAFYLTSLDYTRGPRGPRRGLRSLVQDVSALPLQLQEADGPVKFTYVIWENQRRWVGIGWTNNLLAYERSAWTDEYLNPTESPDQFALPDVAAEGLQWRWVDGAWKCDVTAGGVLVVPPGRRSGVTADPGAEDGWIYFDNTWRNPSNGPAGKFTRRRRWVRVAELVRVERRRGGSAEEEAGGDEGINSQENGGKGEICDSSARSGVSGDEWVAEEVADRHRSVAFVDEVDSLPKNGQKREIRELAGSSDSGGDQRSSGDSDRSSSANNDDNSFGFPFGSQEAGHTSGLRFAEKSYEAEMKRRSLQSANEEDGEVADRFREH